MKYPCMDCGKIIESKVGTQKFRCEECDRERNRRYMRERRRKQRNTPKENYRV